MLLIIVASCELRPDVPQDSGDKIPGPDTTAKFDSLRSQVFIETFNKGEQIFKRYCRTCHFYPHLPARDANTFDQIFEIMPHPSEAYFTRFIQDSKELKLAGDPFATKLDSLYDSKYEHNFKDSLSKKDIQDLIFYIKTGVKLKNE